MKRTNRNGRVTLRDYNKYILHERNHSKNEIMKSAMLMQQFVVMEFAWEESQRLKLLYKNLSKLRSENYNWIQINLTPTTREGSCHGIKLMLPSSFYGGKSWFCKKNMELLAITRAEGKPHLFITITCNPNHPDILRAFPVNVS